MRVILSVIVIGVGVASAALAQTHQPPGKTQPGTVQEGGTDAFASCVSQWEKATHMSKREWERACRRVANRLLNLTVK